MRTGQLVHVHWPLGQVHVPEVEQPQSLIVVVVVVVVWGGGWGFLCLSQIKYDFRLMYDEDIFCCGKLQKRKSRFKLRE